MRDLKHTLKISLDLQESKIQDMDNVIGLNNDANKNLDELKKVLLKQTEQFPK